MIATHKKLKGCRPLYSAKFLFIISLSAAGSVTVQKHMVNLGFPAPAARGKAPQGLEFTTKK
jgi:hypothetical protein